MTGSVLNRGVAVRCNAPQRTPHAPDTAWGRLRQPTGWSLRELAGRTGINAGELSRIERGRTCPTPDQARVLLAAFDGAAR
jgi:plasmid maintenance system antidote protein VapI